MTMKARYNRTRNLPSWIVDYCMLLSVLIVSAVSLHPNSAYRYTHDYQVYPKQRSKEAPWAERVRYE